MISWISSSDGDHVVPFRYGADQTYFEEIKQFYYRDEFSHQVQEWNRQRTLAIERALQQFLYPQMAKELRNKLLAEAKDHIIKVPAFVMWIVGMWLAITGQFDS